MDVKQLYYDERWKAQAIELIDGGYTMHEIDGSILPAVFTLNGEPDLYLYMPNASRMKDRDWKPRPLADKPKVFSVVDSAEHLGCAASTIKHAIYNDKGNSLVADHKIGERGGLVFLEETLLAWHKKRPGPGPPPSNNYLTMSRLYLTNKKFMVGQIRRQIIAGKQDIRALVGSILLEGSAYERDELYTMARHDLDGFMTEVWRLDRTTLIDLIAVKEEEAV